MLLDVADLYTRARGGLFGLGAGATPADRLDVGKRVWSAELVQFASVRRQRGQTWSDIHAEWEATYNPDKHYSNPLSLRRSYQEAESRMPASMLLSETEQPAPWRPPVEKGGKR